MKFLLYIYLFIPSAFVLAHHDGTGADIATTTDTPNVLLIGVGILVATALMWIIFSKPKK